MYPLIPITVSLFGARQAEHRARSAALSATYVGGIAATYSALGLFAALSGKAFGSILSSPAVVAVLALLLVALAASMFGAFEIALPSSLQQRLSTVQGSPTTLGLTLGTNSIIGSVGVGDNQDWVTFTVPTGTLMTKILHVSYVSTDPQGFMGFQANSSTFVGSSGVAGSYTGYAHFGTATTNGTFNGSTIGQDMLVLISTPGVAAGSKGFTPPLAA